MTKSTRDTVVAGSLSALAGVVAGLLLWVAGLDTAFAVAIVPLAAAVGVTWQRLGSLELPLYARRRVEPRPGTRSDLVQLAWALRPRRGQIADPGLKRLIVFARGRLERCGLDLDEPGDAGAVRAVLGVSAAELLTGQRLPSPAEVEHCLDVLEALPENCASPSPQKGHRPL